MDKIKARINKLKEDIDACDIRQQNAASLLVEVKRRSDTAETERSSFQRRIQILKGELAKTKQRLDDKQEQLCKLETKTAEHEVAVKNLESQEVEGDEMLLSLSDQVKRGQVEYEAYDTQWREAKRKEAVLLQDLKKAEARYKEKASRIEQLITVINNTSDEIKHLEARECDQSERDNLNEEKLVFLTDQHKQTLSREEAAERDAARLDRIIRGLKADIKKWKNKTDDVQAQIEDVNNMAEFID